MRRYFSPPCRAQNGQVNQLETIDNTLGQQTSFMLNSMNDQPPTIANNVQVDDCFSPPRAKL